LPSVRSALSRLVALALLAIALAFPATGPARAQTITEIVVEGTQRIDPATVRSYLLLRPGDQVDAEKLDRSMKALFATGLFSDVSIDRQGSRLVAKVAENPIVNRIQFEGNRKLTDEVLIQEIQLKPRQVYTRTKVQNDVKRMIEIYRRAGRFAATVEPKVIELPQNRVDIAFEIVEGEVTSVRKIAFVGNQRFSEARLRDVLNTKESRWYRFLSTADTYDPDRISFDRELLRKFYLAQGYADFRVVSAVAELTPDRESFFVTFTVDEGERYRFGKVDVQSRLRDLKPEQIMGSISTEEGSWYDADQVDQSIQRVTDKIGSLGYAFVDVRPRISRDRDQRTISVAYEVQEGPRVYVDRINVNGNVRTLDRVVRREMKLSEGDAFNTAKLRRSRQRIRGLGYFDKVDVTNVPGESPDRTVINVDVQEKSTGEISFGLGFSTSDGPLADVRLRERNLLGRGQDLMIGAMVSGKRQEIDMAFEEPYFLDYNLAAGFDLFKVKRNFQREASYDVDSYGGAVRARYEMTENLRHTVRFFARSDTIENISRATTSPSARARTSCTIAATTASTRRTAISCASARTSPASAATATGCATASRRARTTRSPRTTSAASPPRSATSTTWASRCASTSASSSAATRCAASSPPASGRVTPARATRWAASATSSARRRCPSPWASRARSACGPSCSAISARSGTPTRRAPRWPTNARFAPRSALACPGARRSAPCASASPGRS
jgi:outer membrane protein insertion porin family